MNDNRVLACSGQGNMPVRPRHHYTIYGLSVASELVLPELAKAAPASDPDVTITVGPVLERLEQPVSTGPTFQIAPGDLLVSIDGIARYRCVGGQRITVAPAAGAPERNVRAFLLGPVLGGLCHQRGLLPLHASAITRAGRAIAFAGQSGAGKSTTAALFHLLGDSVISDDHLPLDLSDDGVARALPGGLKLKLWRDAATKLGADIDTSEPVLDHVAKFYLTLPPEPPRAAAPLHTIYILSRATAGGLKQITRLRGAEALHETMQVVYRRRYLAHTDGVEVVFGRVARVISAVPVFAVPLSHDSTRFSEEAQGLVDHAQGQLS